MGDIFQYQKSDTETELVEKIGLAEESLGAPSIKIMLGKTLAIFVSYLNSCHPSAMHQDLFQCQICTVNTHC